MLNGVTTYYVGNHFEWITSTLTMVKYYYAGGQRVAMRVGSNAPSFLLGDHLGSTSLTANSSGSKVAELRYKPWGESRYTSGVTPTARRFTGQIEDAAIGLYFYNARSYDPSLGRFIQADTMVPSPANPQSLNRYAYTLNNPLRYTDPTGHYTTDAIINYLKENYPDNWLEMWDIWRNDTAWANFLSNAQGGDYFAIDPSSDPAVMLLQFLGTGEDVLEGIVQISQIGTIPQQKIKCEDIRTDKYGTKLNGLLRFDSEGNATIVHQTNPFLYNNTYTELSSYRIVTWQESLMRKFWNNFVELVTFKILTNDIGELFIGTAVDYQWTTLDYDVGDRIVGAHSWTKLTNPFGPSGYEVLGGFDLELP